MDVEPLPKVTFLPAPLTALVIKNWTGDIIDYEKNGQVSADRLYQPSGDTFNSIFLPHGLTAHLDLECALPLDPLHPFTR